MVFAGERYLAAPAIKPLLRAAHLAPNVAYVPAVEVRVGKGSGFTPPHLGVFVAGLRAFFIYALGAGVLPCSALGQAELGRRQLAAARLAFDYLHFCVGFDVSVIRGRGGV